MRRAHAAIVMEASISVIQIFAGDVTGAAARALQEAPICPYYRKMLRLWKTVGTPEQCPRSLYAAVPEGAERCAAVIDNHSRRLIVPLIEAVDSIGYVPTRKERSSTMLPEVWANRPVPPVMT
jgi:hypothetical protein